MMAGPAMAVSASRITRDGVRRVLWITLLLNVAVSAGKILVGKLSGSLAMVADGYHSLVDGSTNVMGLVVATFAYTPPDPGHPYGHRKLLGAFHVLTDRAPIPPDALGPVLAGIPEVIRGIRTRGSADAVFVDLIVHVDGDLSLRAAHDVADGIEEALMRAHPEIVDVVVHLEPAARERAAT